MPSELNALLRKFDSLVYDAAIQPQTKCKSAVELLSGINRLLDTPGFEVHRDLFDGVSDDTRRLVVAGFVAQTSACFIAAIAAEAICAKLQGAPVPENGKDPLGMSSLDKALKDQQNNRRN